jgi:hypothetical protein
VQDQYAIMDKTDVMYGIAAIIIILVMALVVKPMVTGQPVNTGIPVPVTTTSAPVPTAAATPVPTTVVTTTPPTPVPTWDNKVQSIGFVGSKPDDASLTPAPLDATRFDTRLLNTSMTSFAKINGKTSGTTQVIRIPFPYWEIVYTVDPMAESQTSSYQVTPTMGSGVAYSGLSGSYSGVKPEFIIQVMDADDPNRIVRIVTPPGGIDAALWKTAGSTDPRPWTEKFYEGQRSYYFIITAQMLRSYSIDIRVPVRYVGTV